MIYLWILLQVSPALIALYLHQKKSGEIFFTKDSLGKTIGYFLVMSFFITLMAYGVVFINDPNEIVDLHLFTEGKFQEVGFVFKYGVVSLVASIIVGNVGTFDRQKCVKNIFEEIKDDP